MTLIDSDVLIWFTRGHPTARTRLTAINPWRISTITYMELAQGCHGKQELASAQRGLALARTEILPLTPAISERAMRLTETGTPCPTACSSQTRSSPPPPSSTA